MLGSRRMAGVLLVLSGLALVLAALLDHTMSAAPASQRILDSFRPVMKPAAISALQADLNQLGAASQELTTTVVPSLAQSLHLSSAQVDGLLTSRFPATATGMAVMPRLVGSFQQFGGLLASQQSNFRRLDSLPARGVAITTIPWAFFAIGALSGTAGLVTLLGRSRAVPLGAAGLGALVIVAVVGLSFPPKAVSGDHMTAALRPVLTTSTVQQAEQGLTTVQAMTSQLTTQVIPTVAEQLGVAPVALEASLVRQAPALGVALTRMPDYVVTFHSLLAKLSKAVPDFAKAKKVHGLTFLVWLLLGTAITITLSGTITVIARTGEAHRSRLSVRRSGVEGGQMSTTPAVGTAPS
jgi:hypothetical protein